LDRSAEIDVYISSYPPVLTVVGQSVSGRLPELAQPGVAYLVHWNWDLLVDTVD